MTVVDQPMQPGPQEVAWNRCRAATVAAMTAMNLAAVALVSAFGELLEADGWVGWGITSPEHWVAWHANVSKRRAQGLVQIARRRSELPTCWGLFAAGRLTEDSMVRIARRVPTSRDAEVASLAPGLTISQLTRVLSCLPELDPAPPAAGRERFARVHTHPSAPSSSPTGLTSTTAARFIAVIAAPVAARHRFHATSCGPGCIG